MSAVTINQNISSLLVQRRAAQNTASLNDSFQKLSSGLRINRASDDAAGLAIAKSLSTDSRVFSQGIKNINDGISLLSIADGAAAELASIVIRLKELAAQAASGTLSSRQRIPIDKEADELSAEFNRIVQSTEFNGSKLIYDPAGSYLISSGYGAASAISIDPAGGLAYNTGDGSFSARVSFAVAGTTPADVVTGDVNNDGFLDLLSANWNTSGISVRLGNGNGTFKGGVSYATSSIYTDNVEAADMNCDGAIDLVSADWLNGSINIMLNNGNGTFKAYQSYSTGQIYVGEIRTADLNNDGIPDVVSTNSNSGASTTSALLGNANGTLKAQQTIVSGMNTLFGTDIGDINGDGALDVVVTDDPGNKILTFLGNGNGTFKSALTASTTRGFDLILSDVNEDRVLDLVITHLNGGSNSIGIMIGNGNGSYGAENLITVGSSTLFAEAADINGDGIKDIVTSLYSAGAIGVLIGNGNGTFKAVSSYATASNARNPALGDFNGDGAVDIVGAEWGDNALSILFGTPHAVTSISKFDLTTKEGARTALNQLNSFVSIVAKGRGFIGANQSRLEAALSNLQQNTAGLTDAESRIMDADTAQEAANLVRTKILQQASLAILAQTNAIPQIALTLLQGADQNEKQL